MIFIEEKKVREYFSDYKYDCKSINKKIDNLQTALEKFVRFDDYAGEEADSAKSFVSKVEIPMAEDISQALTELKKMQKLLLEDFCDEVDKSKSAVIYTQKLNVIQEDFEDFCEDFNTYCGVVDTISETLESECSQYGKFTIPDGTKVSKGLALLGARANSFAFGMPSGIIATHKKDFQSFEQKHSNDIKGSYFEQLCDSLETCIDTCDSRLESDESVSSIYASLKSVYYNSDIEDLEKYDASKVKDIINWLNSLSDGKLKDAMYSVCHTLAYSGLIELSQSQYGKLSKEQQEDINVLISMMVAYYSKHEEDLYHLPAWHQLLSDFLGFVYDPETKCYHTKEGSLQNAMGFGEMFDKIGPLLGMDLTETYVRFEYNDRYYLFEPWVGKYGYGSCSGGEIGIYSLSKDEYKAAEKKRAKSGKDIVYQSAKENEQLKMKYVIRNKNTQEVICSKDSSKGNGDGTDFWGLAIKTDDHTSKEDLEMVATISHDDIDFLIALQDTMKKEGINAQLNEKTKTISFIYPYSEEKNKSNRRKK